MAMMTIVEKLRAKAAALDIQAEAFRLTATVLEQELREEKRGAVSRTLTGAVALRKAQKNGHAVVEAPPASGKWAKRTAARTAKREQVLAIIQAYGKPMPIAKLRAAARAQGIDSLTGIVSYVRGGLLRVSGQKGQTRYRVVEQREGD